MVSQKEILQRLYGTLREKFNATFSGLVVNTFKPRYAYLLRV